MRRIAAAARRRAASRRAARGAFATYKPPTEKRRDDLHWHVRAEMATRG